MKRIVLCLLVFALLLTLVACQSAAQKEAADAAANADPQTVTELPTRLDTMEYTLYTNIFFNGTGDDYVGQTITKTGTFATIRDSFNGVTRYYVWGYNDETKCCDWQWEFVPKDPSQLPANGSFVKMTGVFEYNEDALDKYWFKDATVEVQKIYQGPDVAVDMGTMSATLERVQLINMQYYPQDYEGWSVRLYARIASLSSLQHPYYDGAWEQTVEPKSTLPAIGTLVLATGKWTADAVLTDCMVAPTSAY